MRSISNEHLELIGDPRSTRWSLYDRRNGGSIERARLALRYRRAGRLFNLDIVDFQKKAWEGESSPTGDQLSLTASDPTRGIDLTVVWKLSPGDPLLRWKVDLKNSGSSPIELELIDMMAVGSIIGRRWERVRRLLPFLPGIDPAEEGTLRPDPSPGELFFFTNGWQSWSYTGTVFQGQRQPRTRMSVLTRPILENPATPRAGGGRHFSSDMFALLGNCENGGTLLIGALSEKRSFASVEARLDEFSPGVRASAHGDRALIPSGGSFETDWFCLQFIDSQISDPMEDYLEAVARENCARADRHTPIGWSSWYYHYGGVAQSDLAEAIEWIETNRPRVPFQLVQLDDGYQAEIGDWDTASDRFPDGPQAVARAVQQSGMTPGLWIAPLVAKPRARTIRTRPDWVLRRRAGTPSNAGYSWDSFVVGLDPTEPDVLAHIQEVVHRAVHEWGFRYLKLDFLYAGALRGRRRNRMLTRAAALRRAYEAIRQAAGEDIFLLACGSPLGPAIGVFDAMRVGPDVAPRWKPSYRGIKTWFGSDPSLPSVRNALRNVLTRAALNRRWWINDPDCLILRGSDTHLSQAEIEALATVVSLTGGSLINSDHLPSLRDSSVDLLASLIPPLEGRLHIRDLYRRAYPEDLELRQSGAAGEWWLAAKVNWQAQRRSVELGFRHLAPGHDGELHGVDFWRGEYVRTVDRRIERMIDPHGACLLALRVERPGVPAWLGDTLHTSQGSQIVAWESDRRRLQAELDLGRTASGTVWLEVPGKPSRVLLDGEPVPFLMLRATTIKIEINVEYGATLAVEY